RMPTSPSTLGATTIVTSPVKTGPSGVRTRTASRLRSPPRSVDTGGRLAGHQAGLLDRLVDGAAHEEGGLGEVVVLAVDDLAEAADGLLDGHVLPRTARERLRHAERLGQEPLDPARPRHRELLLVRELVDAQDGDDVLQV